MSNFEFISITEGGYCGGCLEFKYNGETYKTDSRFLHGNIEFRKINLDTKMVRWAFVPPNLTNEEKEEFVNMLNDNKERILNFCRTCCLCIKDIPWSTGNEALNDLFGTDNKEVLSKREPYIELFSNDGKTNNFLSQEEIYMLFANPED